MIPVLANFPKGSNCLYVEKIFTTNRNRDDVYTPPNSLILKGNPKLHVANFSATATTIQIGQILGKGHNLSSWLDHIKKYFLEIQQKIYAHTKVIQTLVENQTPSLRLGFPKRVSTVTSKVKDLLPTWKIELEEEDIYSEPPLEGGSKTAELPKEVVDSKRLIEVLDINPELPTRLRHLNQAIQVPLKAEVKEISLPPFYASPANQEIIDKQMNKWIQLRVIEPSRSP
jgi:hypothetical protein